MINLQVSLEAPAHHPCATSKALGRNGLFSVGTGVGCCALASLFKRKMCAWQGQQQLWDMLVGGGDLRERLQLFTPPRVPCAHLTAARGEGGQAFHTIHQRPLHSAVSRSPTSRSGSVPGPHKVNKGVHTPPLPLPEDRKPGLGCDLKLTTDTKLSLTLQKLEAVDATTFTVKVILKLSLPCPEVTPAQSLQFALVPVVESCGRA